MSKELPKMYVNKIENDLRNNQNSFCTYQDENLKSEKDSGKKEPSLSYEFTKLELEQKIYHILDPKKYVYKANVHIVTEEGVIQRKIIGYVNGNLITYDNEKISIDTIKDIYL